MATGVEDTHYLDNLYFIEKYQKLGIDVFRVVDHGAHNWPGGINGMAPAGHQSSVHPKNKG